MTRPILRCSVNYPHQFALATTSVVSSDSPNKSARKAVSATLFSCWRDGDWETGEGRDG